MKPQENVFNVELIKEQLKILQKQKDDYAIEFSKWIIINCNHKKMEYLDLKELLEIFKKEKGL